MTTQDRITKYWNGTVQIGANVTVNQRDIINKNHQMRSGQFENPYFADGETEKYYFNVVQGFAQALKRGSRLKISEFSLTSQNGKFLKMVDILRMALRHFLKYNGFADKKDEVLDELVDMGHAVTKVVDGETEIVDLRNLCFRPNAKAIKEDGCDEKRYLTYEEAKAEFGENKHWKEIEDYWEKVKDDENFLTFVESWVVDEFKTENGKETTKGCIVQFDRSGDPKPDTNQEGEEWNPYLEIDRFASPYKVKTRNKHEKKIYGKERRVFPYDEQRLIVIPGRYLGMGVYEMCRPAQEDYNEKRNFKRKFDRLALRGILVHKVGQLRNATDGEALTQEFLKRMDTGYPVKIFNDESLERLNIGSTTGDTLAMINDLFEFMRFMLGVTPIAIGNDPKNKTAYYAMTQAQTQQTTYQVIKNKTARLFERLFQDFLLDDVVDEVLSGEIIPLYGDKQDFAEMDRFLAENEVNSALAKRPGMVSKEDISEMVNRRIEDSEKFGGARFIDIADSTVKKAFRKLLKNIDYLVEFNITDEGIDNATKIQTIIQADQMQNEKLRDRVLDLTGISPKEIRESDDEKKKRLEEEATRERALAEAKQVPETPVNPVMQAT